MGDNQNFGNNYYQLAEASYVCSAWAPILGFAGIACSVVFASKSRIDGSLGLCAFVCVSLLHTLGFIHLRSSIQELLQFRRLTRARKLTHLFCLVCYDLPPYVLPLDCVVASKTLQI